MALHAPVRLFLMIHAFLHVASVLFNFLRVEFTPKPDGWRGQRPFSFLDQCYDSVNVLG